MTKNLTSLSKTDASGKLDKKVEAVCECGKETRAVTFRNLKNKWPHCQKCKQPMKVISNAVSSFQASD
jgi:hypothetical protein